MAPANNTPIMIGSSVLAVADGTEGEARRHPRLLMRMIPDSAASHGGILMAPPSASPQLERDLGHFPEPGRRARSLGLESHPKPASPEARSKTRLHAAGGRAGDEWRHHCHKPDHSVNILSTDRTVAAHVQARDQSLAAADTQRVEDQPLGTAPCTATQPWRDAASGAERAITISTLTMPSEDKGGRSRRPLRLGREPAQAGEEAAADNASWRWQLALALAIVRGASAAGGSASKSAPVQPPAAPQTSDSPSCEACCDCWLPPPGLKRPEASDE